ncbi:uncharacterized protein [Watersipora subatra]|uniref:uncharacterized protein isoform X2 n=1 Tax=Watersipora subatra TaxID=2589382 RepID=UPI00355B4105
MKRMLTVAYLVLMALLSVRSVSTTDGLEGYSLYDTLAYCLTNISHSLEDYQNTELIELSEPMLAFLNGSYGQWTLERSLEEDSLDSISTNAVFDQYSFNTSVLPKLVTHCSLVNQQLRACLIEVVEVIDSSDEEIIIIDKIHGLSSRYCIGTEPREDIITNLMNLYVPMGELFDMVWPSQANTTLAQVLETACGSSSSLTENLLEIAHHESPLLSAIATAEETILRAIRCYATELNQITGMDNTTKDMVVRLTGRTLDISAQDVNLFQLCCQ